MTKKWAKQQVGMIMESVTDVYHRSYFSGLAVTRNTFGCLAMTPFSPVRISDCCTTFGILSVGERDLGFRILGGIFKLYDLLSSVGSPSKHPTFL